MTPDILEHFLCESADLYYTWLSDMCAAGQLKGVKTITVSNIAHGKLPFEYILTTNERLSFPDSCQIYVCGKRCPIIIHSHSKYSALIIDKDGIISPSVRPEDILIVSDMLHLIKRIRVFYENHTLCLKPPSPIHLPTLPTHFTETLSPEQLDAVNAVFNNSITYISGAPGTGKTKAVLSRCILRYILAKEKILLLAPTNNAVEQMLRGILPILRENGIALEKVYRLGASSEEFANEYPTVIGDADLDRLLLEIEAEKANCILQIERAEAAHSKAALYQQRISACTLIHECVCQHLAILADIVDELSIIDDLIVIETQNANTLTVSKEAVARADSALAQHESVIVAKSNRLAKIRRFFWKKKETEQLSTELDQLFSELPNKKNTRDVATKDYHYAVEHFSQSAAEVIRLSARKERLISERSLTIDAILSLSACDTDYCAIAKRVCTFSCFDCSELDDLLLFLEACRHEALEEYNAIPLDSIRSKLNSLDQKLNTLRTNIKYFQKENAFVLAGTIDSALNELSSPTDDSSKSIRHVFLDEAGYTSLARGLAAFALNVPVTFLGDHKQLPPVCEMNDIPPELASVCLWSLPVSFLSELIHARSFDHFYHFYKQYVSKPVEPSFAAVSYRSLNKSYRFGPLLAGILGKYVYSHSFCGVPDAPFHIQVINAPFVPGPRDRTSKAECFAIRKYLSDHDLESVAILSPYRNQVKYLRSILPHNYQDSIFTVHRSQGREWDTVILSVTDTYKPYFTDSSLPIGRSILNTAISRAKHNLVIVCDKAQWLRRKDQMLTALILASEDHM